MLDSKREYGTREPGTNSARNVDREVDEPIRRTERIGAGRRLPYEKHVAPTRVRVCEYQARKTSRWGVRV